MSLDASDQSYHRSLSNKQSFKYPSDKRSASFVFPKCQTAGQKTTHNLESLASDAESATATSKHQEQALLSAIYNTIAISLFVACLGLLAVLYIVLESFLKPIFWALLTSAFLFSSKRFLTETARSRLADIETRETILALESFLFPFELFDAAIDRFGSFLKQNVFSLIALIFTVLFFNLMDSYYDAIFQAAFVFVNFIYKVTTSVAYYSDNSYQVTLALIIGYIVGITVYWKNGENALLFQILSFPIWINLLFHVSKLMGSYRPLVIFIFCVLACLGVVSFVTEYVKKRMAQMSYHQELLDGSFLSDLNSSNEALLNDSNYLNETRNAEADQTLETEQSQLNKSVNLDDVNEPEAEGETNVTTTNEENNKQQTNAKSPPLPDYKASFTWFVNVIKNTMSQEPEALNTTGAFNRSSRRVLGRSMAGGKKPRAENNNSDKYFSLLFWLFLVVNIRVDLYFVVAIIVLAWKLVKNFIYYLYKFVTESKSFQEYWLPMASEWIRLRSDALMPGPFIFLMTLFVKGDHRANQWLQKSMDKLISGLIIIFLLLFIVFAFTFLSIQVHKESIQLVENVFNENLYKKPYLRNWLPEKESVNKVYQEAVNNLYFYGREWLTERLKTTSYNTTTADGMVLEKQLLKQWDVIYTYLSRNSTKALTSVTAESRGLVIETMVLSQTKPDPKNSTLEVSNWEKLGKNLKRMMSFMNGRDSFDYQYFAVIFKDNLGTVYAILESTYRILKGNLEFLTKFLVSFTSLIFSSGFALISFGFSFIIYCTFLFYLLSMSGSLYKPFQWLSEIIIMKTEFSIMSVSRSQILTNAIEESIKGVFLASFKMAAFYGLFTYTMYNLFGSSIAAIPAIAAALFAFLPILATYITSLPGVLEIWLIHDQPLKAIIFFLIQMLPTYFVDAAIYSEIKGGNSYLTGLAFAGGVYCLGLEGAIIGPIVLCLLIVIGKMLTTSQRKPSGTIFNKSIQIPLVAGDK